uniref:Predicted nucleic-acid-binding protein, contains PIN domain n=1 Tax=Candidatus Kentrum sp. FM TaxID=2126340 RepID=A0A450W8H7_9GAMM|nr:MAG: Predicted nucleic-acid-binding protein, contains PIN domain [Candidatus Kentron sp. FM]VFJ60700.1 MAG: Predicted nucleic-acid-binding protein, contains PIN domain [Candidatus Kentron sp. FM]VFK13298.1 MAG: Predicted nucleic-acid-binding protein, contains PIN domain [Candidatus Kentron sp. FM]
MIAFDTNLLVRLAVNDDRDRAGIAEYLLETQQVFVPRTVLLETEWVLRSVYKKSRTEISNFLASALMTTNLIVENSSEVANAMEWYRLGSDFADAMHLCMCGEAKIHTFDTDFCKAAKESGLTPAFEVLNT